MKILFVRHGQSLGNEQGLFCGEYDCGLSDNGLIQGEMVCDYIFKNFNVGLIYSSALIRANQTVKKLSKLTGIETRKLKEFNELYAGKWEGLEISKIANDFPDDYYIWKHDVGKATPTGGEKWESMLERVKVGLNLINNDYQEKLSQNKIKGNDIVVVATHGGVIRLIETYYKFGSLDNMQSIPFAPNCSITALEIDNQSAKIVQSGFCDFLGNNKTLVPKGI